jgi:hypothetical protein
MNNPVESVGSQLELKAGHQLLMTNFVPSNYLTCLPSSRSYIKHKNNDQLELLLNSYAVYSMTLKTKTFLHTFGLSQSPSYSALHTNYMGQSPSSEANKSSASQEILRILQNSKFITACTRARHLSLSWSRSVQSLPPHHTSWRTILILSSHLRLGLPTPGVSPP